MYSKRVQDVSARLNSSAAFIESCENCLYLTGFKCDAAYMLLVSGTAYYFTDSRYIEAASSCVKSATVMPVKNFYEDVKAVLKKHGVKQMEVEGDFITVDAAAAYKKHLDVEISTEMHLSELLYNMRSVKSDFELAQIKAAQKLTDKTFSEVLNFIDTNKTEKEIALFMEFFIRKSGSEGASFDFIAVSGKNTSLPHGVPTERKIKNGDFITMDFGAIINGYHSDMTRTVAVGSITEKQAQVYAAVLAAQKAALKHIKSGIAAKDADKAARDIIESAGYGEYFGHALGHGVGLNIHEQPSLSPKSAAVLKSGNIVTVEPGIYLPGEFGVRIEDTVAVTDSGNTDITKSAKELIIL